MQNDLEIQYNGVPLKEQFSILSQEVNGHPLVYLDNAATTQKPESVINAISTYYRTSNANVHRGVHTLSDRSTHVFESTREKVSRFFDATPDQLMPTRNTTEAINILARMFASRISAGDVIISTLLEHHSNFVPWQQLAKEKGAKFFVLPLTSEGQIDLDAFRTLVRENHAALKLLALSAVSNALGTVAPLADIDQILVDAGIRKNVLVVVDAAQAAAHMPCSLERLHADAFAFSGHKMYGPMGIGGLILSKQLLSLEPTLFGGGMIDTVSLAATTYHADPAERFVAGTPDVAGMVGLAAAVEFVEKIGWKKIQSHEHSLIQRMIAVLEEFSEISIVGPRTERVGSVSWIYDGVHAHDVAQVLDNYGVEVRSGHHCTMPLHTQNNWIATTRASFAIYNTESDIARLSEALTFIAQIFRKEEK